MKAQDIPTALALAAGVMKTTDVVKEVFERATGMVPQPYLKSLLATSLSAGAAVLYGGASWRDRLLMASAVAGSSAVMHEGYAALSTRADANKAQFIRTAARGAIADQLPSAPGRRIRPL